MLWVSVDENKLLIDNTLTLKVAKADNKMLGVAIKKGDTYCRWCIRRIGYLIYNKDACTEEGVLVLSGTGSVFFRSINQNLEKLLITPNSLACVLWKYGFMLHNKEDK
jgi:hypothetical protein